jgi:hypothetical protein
MKLRFQQMSITVDLPSIFIGFCEHFEGRLVWAERGKIWTDAIISFFREEAGRHKCRCEQEYMTLDMVWWSEYSDIMLALEHEIQERAPPALLEKEIRHLIDIKAQRKVGIFYPSEADEKSLIENAIIAWLEGHRLKVADFAEQYMFVMGRPTTKFGRRAILFRRYLFDGYGNQVSSPQEFTLKQADRRTASATSIR